MNIPSIQEIVELTSDSNGWRVSIFLPTHPAGQQGQQDALRLKNLLSQAEEMLVARGMRGPDARDYLQAAKALPQDQPFWEARGRGLAIFIGGDRMRHYRVPVELEEAAIVDKRFHVRRLLPAVAAQQRAYVLAVSRNHVRLLAVQDGDCERLMLPGMPSSMEEALNISSVDRGEQVHAAMHLGSGGKLRKESGVFHGQGGKAECMKDEVAQYCRLIAEALHTELNGQDAPLLLAGVQYELSIFRSVCPYPHIARDELRGNFDHASDHELFQQARPLLAPLLHRQRQAALDRYRQLGGTGKASDDLSAILGAAFQGRIDTLFIRQGADVTGSFDAASGSLSYAAGPHADDLLELALAQTLRGGGSAYALQPEEMPSPAPAAAVLRY